MDRFRELYFALWATVLPLASLLVIPNIQGTTPGNLLALSSIIWVPFLRRDKARQCMKALAYFALVWLGLFVLAEGGLYLFANPKLPSVLAVEALDPSVLLRKSIFTQSAYLLACYLTAIFIIFNYKSEWRRYLFWGAWLLAGYGIYEWLYYLVMKQPGDFIANRTFLGGEHPGSWNQIFHLGSLELLRIKSVTGEPSFLALAGVPYLALAVESRKWPLVGALAFCLALSFSTTGYIAIFIGAIFSMFYFNAWKGKYLAIAGGLVLAGVVAMVLFPDFVEVVFAKKLSGEGASGGLRQHVFLNAVTHWSRLSFFNMLVGIGFGSAFVTPFIGGLLVNTGLVGVGLYIVGFFYPLVKLPNTPENWSVKVMLVMVFFMLSVSVADFTYLTTWMVIGLAYRRVRQGDRGGSHAEYEPPKKERRRERRRSAPAGPSPTREVF